MPTTSAKKPITKTKTAAPKRTSTTTAKKPVSGTRSKTTASKASTTKPAAKKAPAKKTTPTPPVDNRERGPHGYALGTDSAIIAESLIEGGATRDECNDRATALIAKTSGLETRGGKPKYIPSMAASIISRLTESGQYRVESSFRLVPVNGDAPAKPTNVKTAPVRKKAPAKKTTAGTRQSTARKPAAK